MTVFERIKKLSANRDKNLQEVAELLGFSKNIFYKWKTSEPKARDLEKVADYFNVSVDYLLGRDAEENQTAQTAADDIALFLRVNTANMDPEDAEEIEEEIKDYAAYLIQKAREKKARRKNK